MARLNEPPVAPDSLEILRRRFLRQNRDIAKINSVQSLKIRGLENECARLLSENLDLRGQIIRLEKEVERNSAQRIADHALEIKAKMEAQLEEWGAMLAGLGVEPPTKRRSIEKRKSPKPRLSGSWSPPQRKRRNTEALDALAAQEGRLPPIYEHKSYPRATMNTEEILALFSEAAGSSNNSPDLGPPPVSRYVDGDPVKMDSPSPKRSDGSPTVQTNSNGGGLEDDGFTPEILNYGKKLLDKPDLSPRQEIDLGSSKQPAALEEVVHPIPPLNTTALITTAKSSTKRKYGDENEQPKVEKLQVGKENGPLQSRRVIKDISSSRRDKAGNVKKGPLSARPPLATKSTNDDVSSPRKMPKETGQDDVKLVKAQKTRQTVQKDSQNAHEQTTVIEAVQPEPEPEPEPAPEPAPEPEVATVSEPDIPSSPVAASVDTPVRSAQRNAPHDTPPPLDINSNGETVRPSRRARPAVSYAEPSLRVKMRRPTKELFDAVSGEGKFIQRSGTQAPSGSTSAPTSATRPKTETDCFEGSSSKNLPPTKDQHSRRQSAMSPLAQKQLPSATLPDTVTSDCGKQPSEAAPSQALDTKAQGGEDQPLPESGIDIYDFASSSPSTGSLKQQQTGGKGRNSRRSSAAVSSSRKTAATAADDEYTPETSTVATSSAPSKSRSSHARKRASMQAPKKTPMAELLSLEEGEAGEGDVSIESVSSTSSGPGSKIAAKDKVTRRRSMML